MTPSADLVSALGAAVGPAHVLTDPQTMASYCTDWTGRFSGTAPAVVRPGSTAEVAAVIAVCAKARAAVVPQGGNTGLVGGGVPRQGEVVLSLRRLDSIHPLDTMAGTVHVGAGATLGAVQDAVATHGLAVGVDLASRDSATIGGMVATNAGGIRVVAHGSMRQQVIGIEAVLADGSVVRRLPGLAKDNSGYDLIGILAGSEGTLAVITAVNLRLVAIPQATSLVLVACEDVDDAVAILADARRVGRLLAVEMMRPRGLALVCAHLGIGPAIDLADGGAALLIEWEGTVTDEVMGDLVSHRSAAVAQDVADQARLWRYREAHTESISAVGVPVKLDVTLPLAGLSPFLAELSTRAPHAITFGHLAEGNVHVNLLGDDRRAEADVLRLVAAHHGSISSEHGIGVAKRDFLALTRDDADLALMRRLKQAMDPTGLLNPGAILVGP